MNEGLKKIKHPLLKKLFKKQEFSTKGDKNIQNTQFFINPLINSAIRVGSSEEKDQMMRAFLLSKEKVPYKNVDKVKLSLCQYMMTQLGF